MSQFKKYTEEERRAHIRTKNAAYQAKKESRLTETEKRVKEQEKKKKMETKEKLEAGEWVSTGRAKPKKPEVAIVPIKVKNGFSALESDEECEPKIFVKKKINWADSDDE